MPPIDPFSQEFGALQATAAQLAAELAAHRAEVLRLHGDNAAGLRALETKVDALRDGFAEVRRLRAIIAGEGDGPGLAAQVKAMTESLVRGRAMVRLLLYFGAAVAAFAAFGSQLAGIWTAFHHR